MSHLNSNDFRWFQSVNDANYDTTDSQESTTFFLLFGA